MLCCHICISHHLNHQLTALYLFLSIQTLFKKKNKHSEPLTPKQEGRWEDVPLQRES